MPDLWDLLGAAASGTGSRDRIQFRNVVAGAIGVGLGFGTAYALAIVFGDALGLVAAALLLFCAGVGLLVWHRFRKNPVGTGAGMFAIICVMWGLLYGLAGS